MSHEMPPEMQSPAEFDEVHISSLVVSCQPSKMAQVRQQIDHIDGAQVYGDNPKGKLVVLLETATSGYITDIIDRINLYDGVLFTAMIYHQVDSGIASTQRP